MRNTVLWTYILLLVAGGLFGFFKAKSKISLITSVISAALLILTAIPGLLSPRLGSGMAYVIMAILLVVFGIRLAKTNKFMPSGMMLLLTLMALVLRHLL